MVSAVIGQVPAAAAATVAAVSSAVTLLCVVPLIVLTWQRKAHPSPVTWGTWFAVGVVATVGMALGGAPTSAWLLKLGLSLGPLGVAAVALYRGEPWRADRIDRWSLALGAAGFIAYVLVYFGALGPANPETAGLVAVGMAMLVDAIGAGPTCVRAWRHPRDELILTYALALVSVIAVLAILPWPWTLLSAAYLSFLAAQMALIIAVLWGGRRRARIRRIVHRLRHGAWLLHWHVRVTPVPNEPDLITDEQAAAALRWLHDRVDDGTFTRCLAFARTGGFIELYAESSAAVERLMAPYALRGTITLDIDLLVSLPTGFALLQENIRRHRSVAVIRPDRAG